MSIFKNKVPSNRELHIEAKERLNPKPTKLEIMIDNIRSKGRYNINGRCVFGNHNPNYNKNSL